MEGFGRSCWDYFGTFFALKRFLGAFFASCCICRPFWSFFSRLGTLQPRFWSPKLAICWHTFRSWRHFSTCCRDCCKKTLLAFTFCFSFPQCSAAVRAQHMELNGMDLKLLEMLVLVLLLLPLLQLFKLLTAAAAATAISSDVPS